MVAKVVIFNEALTLLSKPRISSPDQTDFVTSLLNEQYEPALDAALQGHPWNFALRRLALPASLTKPVYGYAYAYPYPSDPFGLRPWDLADEAAHWEDEGREILTDLPPPLKCRFIVRVTDTSVFTPLFVEALAAKLAHKTAFRLTDSRSVEGDMKELFKDRLALARSIDGQTGKPERKEPSAFLESRL